MDDELKNRERQTDQETHESGGDETTDLKTKVSELEQALKDRDTEIDTLKRTGGELEEKCRTLDTSLSEAVTRYRALVVESNPGIIEDLISGETIESINRSLEKAKEIVSKVRQGVEAEISREKVPAGSPERSTPDLSALSPGEKIRYAIGGNE